MNDADFHAFRTNPDIDLVSPADTMMFCEHLAFYNFLSLSACVEQSLLGDRSHRLLSAAQAAKMAVVYSQYTSLYVLTNVVSYLVALYLKHASIMHYEHTYNAF